MPSLPHIMISASAGSGKTYQLVRRYLHLLALGVEPQRIAAMTFTRKASGEFFNRILNRLSELAAGKLDPDVFFKDMKPQPAQWPDFLKLLREMTQSMQQLRLGTLDSFFASVQACFPLELGLPLGASVMDENAALEARSEVLAGLIDRIYREHDEVGATALLEGFKIATFGAEEKQAESRLEDWIAESHDLWMEREDEALWGDPTAIWPSPKAPTRRSPLPTLTEAVVRLRSAIDPDQMFTVKTAEKWRELVDGLLLTEPGLALPKAAKTLLEKCSEGWDDLRRGNAELTFWQKKTFTGAQAEALLHVCETLLARELLLRCKRTRGTASVVAGYEQEYARSVRGQGRLSFADVQRLLARAAAEWLHTAGAEALWYRLDSRYDHWLFDEFQDTSFQQWYVVRGLVEEIVQSDTGERSFFAVGDPKQSIYLWRQAEPKLFQQILDAHPAKAGRGIQRQELAESYRSAQAVLDAVNAVFGDAEALARLLPGSTKLWQFSRHEAAKKELVGYATMLFPERVATGEEQPAPDDIAVQLLNAVQPLRRGMTCAVLVRGNAKAQEIADKLRAETGMEVVCESKQTPATDNAATLALLSVLQLAAHPGDTFALEHLRMTPLWPVIEGMGKLDEDGRAPSPVAALCRSVQRLVFNEGFVGFAKLWTEHIEQVLVPLDAFTAMRLTQFGDLAAAFDESGSRDLDDFIAHARAYTLRTRGASAAIQVMTVHAAKGLEFDMVILPDLGGDGMNQVRSRDLIRRRDDEGLVQWVLQEPPSAYAKIDEVLSAERTETMERTGFESLCRLYVAMTRAVHGLYLITEPPPKTESKAEYMKTSRLLHEILGTGTGETESVGDLAVVRAWENGEREWFTGKTFVDAVPTASVTVREPLGPLLRRTQPMTKRRTPSGEEDFKLKGSVHFSPGRQAGRELGSLVHALFEQVEWLDEGFDEAALGARWTELELDQRDAFPQAQAQVVSTLRSAACRAAFALPDAHAQLWRERPFDLVLDDGGWLSGVFDRVIVERDAAGKARRVRIIDFKTDDVPTDVIMDEKVAGYAPQLALYRQAAARLTGVALEHISATLVFTRVARLRAVGAS